MIDLEYSGRMFGIGALHYQEAVGTYAQWVWASPELTRWWAGAPYAEVTLSFSTAVGAPRIMVHKAREDCRVEVDSSLIIGVSQLEQEQRFYDDLLTALERLRVVFDLPPVPAIPALLQIQTHTPESVDPEGASTAANEGILNDHPGFSAHFRADFYLDETNEFAPFGTDAGQQVLADLLERRDQFTNGLTLRELIGPTAQHRFDEVTAADPDLNELAELIAYGFGLLRFTGSIDNEGRRLILRALRRTQQQFDHPVTELYTMTTDLGSYLPHQADVPSDQ